MKNILFILTLTVALVIGGNITQAATYDIYTVKSGDSMWKIAVKYQMGVQEIINTNPEIENPNLIYPNQKIKVPLKSKEETTTETQILSLVNNERSKVGIKPLVLNWELSRVAKIKCQDMINNNYFSHQSPTYGSPFDMMKKFGISYRSAGENIAAGQKTPQEVMNAWMNSSGHRANILSSNYSELGVGKQNGGSYGVYWTQMFIKK